METTAPQFEPGERAGAVASAAATSQATPSLVTWPAPGGLGSALVGAESGSSPHQLRCANTESGTTV